jgi:two-component system, NarL family, nitrate/nitrite response regulator NarL
MNPEVVYNERVLPFALNASSYVTTVLVCQSSLVRSGIRYLLSGTHFVISEETLDHPSELPILCLVHIDTLDAEVTETVEKLKVQWPSARVVLLTNYMDAAAIVPVFQAGLDGLCSTAMDREPLIRALELVMLGETFIAAAAGNALLQQRQAGPPAHAIRSSTLSSATDFPSVNRLSERETQILHSLTKGASNKLIANNLGVAEATIKVHIKAILRKVQVANRTQAAMWAQRHMNRVADGAPRTAE